MHLHMLMQAEWRHGLVFTEPCVSDREGGGLWGKPRRLFCPSQTEPSTAFRPLGVTSVRVKSSKQLKVQLLSLCLSPLLPRSILSLSLSISLSSGYSQSKWPRAYHTAPPTRPLTSQRPPSPVPSPSGRPWYGDMAGLWVAGTVSQDNLS